MIFCTTENKETMGICNTKYLFSRQFDSRDKVQLDMFLFQSVLGEGGFGKVLCGMFVHTDTWYAVKCISKNTILTLRTGDTMLFNELDSLKKIPHHPFVCGLHYAFQNRTTCYFVLDLKRGGDLRYYLDKEGILFHERDIAIYISCLSSCLEHIHRHGVIHRDIKPDNIILDSKGFPCLSDFGVAFVSKDQGSMISTLASGTKAYLAPEVFTRSHIHGPECDYWSLGIVVYEMLYGHRPFNKCPKDFVKYAEILQKRDLISSMDRKNKSLSGNKRSIDETMDKPIDDSNIRDVVVAKDSLGSSQLSPSNNNDSMDSTSSQPNPVKFDTYNTIRPEIRVEMKDMNVNSEIDEKMQILPRIPLSPVIHSESGEVEVSSSCMEVLSGLLDVRPATRFGCKNIDTLMNHPWFLVDNKLNHQSIYRSHDSMKPRFQPGETYIRNICLEQRQYAEEDATSDHEDNEDNKDDTNANVNANPIPVMKKEESNTEIPISMWQQNRFHNFYYCRQAF